MEEFCQVRAVQVEDLHGNPPMTQDLHERCHSGRLLGAHLADNIAPWHTYALVRAIQAQARQPMDARKVAKRDTKASQRTVEAPSESIRCTRS